MKSSAVTRFAVGAMVLAALVLASPAAGALYMSDGQEQDPDIWSSLYTLDPANGSATLVGRVRSGGSDIELEDIAYSPLAGTMYGVTYTELYTLDFQNPSGGVVAATLIGSIAGVTNSIMRGLTVSRDGTLYGGTSYDNDSSPGSLYTIDPTSAAATLIGSLGTEGAYNLNSWALAMSGAGQLYGTVYAVEPGDAWLAEIDPLTGDASVVGAIPWAVEGMAFAAGALYGGSDGDFYLIDPVTGGTTVLGNNGLEMTGLTEVPSTVPVPVPGAAALALFGLATATRLLRRRK